MRRGLRTARTGAVIGAIIALAGCTSSPQVGAASGPSAPGALPTATLGAPAMDDHGDAAALAPSPTWDPASEVEAVRVATGALTAFARPDLDEQTWWTGLAPYLSPTAALAYQGTDPANVPARALTGAGQLEGESTPYLARARFPTDVGMYTVLVSRDGAGAGWVVEAITPTAEVAG